MMLSSDQLKQVHDQEAALARALFLGPTHAEGKATDYASGGSLMVYRGRGLVMPTHHEMIHGDGFGRWFKRAAKKVGKAALNFAKDNKAELLDIAKAGATAGLKAAQSGGLKAGLSAAVSSVGQDAKSMARDQAKAAIAGFM